MRLSSILAAALAAAALAGAAQAQTPQPDPDAATRIQLARQLFDLSGGAQAGEAQIKSIFATASKVVAANVPAEQMKLTTAIQRDMQDELLGMVPSMIDAGVQAYADNLTAKELRDYIAWLSSDTGKALVAKAPAIQQEILQSETPMIAQMIPTLQHKVADRVCEEMHCTAKERQIVADAMAKAFAPQKS